MPAGVVDSARDERLWAAAKKAAKDAGRSKDWAYINGTFQRMKKAEDDPEEGEARPMPIEGISAKEVSKAFMPGMGQGKPGLQPKAASPPAGHLASRGAQIGEVHDWGQGKMRKVAPGKWEPVEGAKPGQPQEQPSPTGAPEPPQEGSSDHHRGQAMIHMRAAMAHAQAHQSAKEQEEAASHDDNVAAAREAEQAAADSAEGKAAEPQTLEDKIKTLMEEHGAEQVAAATSKAVKGTAAAMDKAFQEHAKKAAGAEGVQAAAQDAIAAAGIKKGGEAPSKSQIDQAVKHTAQDPNVKSAAREALGQLEDKTADILTEQIGKAAPEEGKKAGWGTKLKAAVKLMAKPFTFGFIDNFMMYMAGSAVDGAVQGAGFGSAATAGIGNAISDAVGEASGGWVERKLEKVGASEAQLKEALGEKTYERMEKMLQPVGVFLGALVGMIPLAFGVKFGKSMSREADIMKAKAHPSQMGFNFDAPPKGGGGQGEGSRGGQVVGHTASGKAIYAKKVQHHQDKAKKHAAAAAKATDPGVREKHTYAAKVHQIAAAAHRVGHKDADKISEASKVHSKRTDAARPTAPQRPKLERPASADRPPGRRATAAAPRKVSEPMTQPGSGSHLQFSMEDDMDMAKDHSAAQVKKLADRIMGGETVDEVLDTLGNDDVTKKNVLAELRRRKASKGFESAEMVEASMTKSELRKGLITFEDLRSGKLSKGLYGRFSEWANQFMGSPLYVEALRCLKERIGVDKEMDAARSKHKSWRELEELPRTRRQEVRKKQDKEMEAYYKREEAIKAKMGTLEEKLLDHRIEEAQRMGKSAVVSGLEELFKAKPVEGQQALPGMGGGSSGGGGWQPIPGGRKGGMRRRKAGGGYEYRYEGGKAAAGKPSHKERAADARAKQKHYHGESKKYGGGIAEGLGEAVSFYGSAAGYLDRGQQTPHGGRAAAAAGKHHKAMAKWMEDGGRSHGAASYNLKLKLAKENRAPTRHERAAGDAHDEAEKAYWRAQGAHNRANETGELKDAQQASKLAGQAEWAGRKAHHASEAQRHAEAAGDHLDAIKIHQARGEEGEADVANHQAAVDRHNDAEKAHMDAYQNHPTFMTREARKKSDGALAHSRKADKATNKAHGIKRALSDTMDDLIKAANGEPVSASMRPQNGKDKDTDLVKQKGKGNGDEDEENGPGDSEHHKDQAMSHLAAAQAHATAHRSAKQLESADDHQQNVQAAQAASMAAAPPAEEKKPMKAIKKGGMVIHLDAEDEILAGLGADGLSVQGAALDPYGKQRLAASGRGDPNPEIRAAAFEKGGIAGGSIYQGEHDVQGSRPGDSREEYMRQQELAQVVEQDPAGFEGQGGLPDWWRDAGHLVNVPAGMNGPVVKAVEPPTVIVDDSDPYTRAMHNTDPREGQMGPMMAHHGKGKGRGTL